MGFCLCHGDWHRGQREAERLPLLYSGLFGDRGRPQYACSVHGVQCLRLIACFLGAFTASFLSPRLQSRAQPGARRDARPVAAGVVVRSIRDPRQLAATAATALLGLRRSQSRCGSHFASPKAPCLDSRSRQAALRFAAGLGLCRRRCQQRFGSPLASTFLVGALSTEHLKVSCQRRLQPRCVGQAISLGCTDCDRDPSIM